jgi:hypothetical protein
MLNVKCSIKTSLDIGRRQECDLRWLPAFTPLLETRGFRL